MSRRAWVIPEVGEPIEVPPQVIDYEEIIWPFEAPDSDMVDYGFRGGDVYRRHEVLSGAAYTYLRPGMSLEDVPPSLLDLIVHESAGETAIAD